MTTEAEPEHGEATGGGSTGGGNGVASVASGAEAAATFAIEGEDDTLANALRFHLNKK